MQYVDTARAYTRRGEEGHNEALIARVLERLGDPPDVLVATKGGHYRDVDAYRIDGSPEALRADCERSLRALRRESIDLYYLHHPDPLIPLDPILNSVPDMAARARLISSFDLETTQPEWALGYRFDIVLRGRKATPFEEPSR